MHFFFYKFLHLALCHTLLWKYTISGNTLFEIFMKIIYLFTFLPIQIHVLSDLSNSIRSENNTLLLSFPDAHVPNDLYQSLNWLPVWNSQNCSMFPLAFVAGWLQGHWWGFISRNYVVWPTFLLMNVFIALKGSHFWFLFRWPVAVFTF